MASRRLPFFQSLFRNRRGGVCAICCCLVFSVATTVSVWAFLCLDKRTFYDVPPGVVALITAIGAIKGWQYHKDSSTALKAP